MAGKPGRRAEVDGGRKMLGLRIPPDMHQQLTDEADARGVPVTWLVERLLAEGLENLRPADEFRLTRQDP